MGATYLAQLLGFGFIAAAFVLGLSGLAAYVYILVSDLESLPFVATPPDDELALTVLPGSGKTGLLAPVVAVLGLGFVALTVFGGVFAELQPAQLFGDVPGRFTRAFNVKLNRVSYLAPRTAEWHKNMDVGNFVSLSANYGGRFALVLARPQEATLVAAATARGEVRLWTRPEALREGGLLVFATDAYRTYAIQELREPRDTVPRAFKYWFREVLMPVLLFLFCLSGFRAFVHLFVLRERREELWHELPRLAREWDAQPKARLEPAPRWLRLLTGRSALCVARAGERSLFVDCGLAAQVSEGTSGVLVELSGPAGWASWLLGLSSHVVVPERFREPLQNKHAAPRAKAS